MNMQILYGKIHCNLSITHTINLRTTFFMIYFTTPNMAYCITKVVSVYNKSDISNKVD